MPDDMIERVARAIRREAHRKCCLGAALDDICALPLNDDERRAARAAIAAHNAALTEAGYVIVPQKESATMHAAGRIRFVYLARRFPQPGDTAEAATIADGAPSDIYRAMIAAALGEAGDG